MTIEQALHRANIKGSSICYSGICKICKNVFYRYYRHDVGYYCSKKCYQTTLPNGKYVICVNCKKEKYRTPSKYNASKRQFCSFYCFKAYNRCENSHKWLGWRMNNNGYMKCEMNGKIISQHRVIMEKHIGRKLEQFEHIHHKNGIRHDNRVENLELWATRQPYGQRVADLVKFCVNNYSQDIRSMLKCSCRPAIGSPLS